MKPNFLFYFAVLLIPFSLSVSYAAMQGDNESGQMNIEKVITMCGEQYNENVCPDAKERSKLVDQ
jgi:hypothetical protein